MNAGGALVVGASSGIGRATVACLAQRGVPVVAAARRGQLLEELAEAHEPLVAAHPCDAADAEACAATVARAVSWSHEHGTTLRTVVYAAGTAPLAPVADTDAEQWRHVLGVNLVGAAMVTRAALGHLRTVPGASLVLLSSHSVGRPWPGLVPYAASKAGLVELARGLRAEEPAVRVVVVNVGNTITGFADGWDPELLVQASEAWVAGGYLRHDVLTAEVVGAAVADATEGGPDELDVIGPPFA